MAARGAQASASASRYQDFENGRTGLRLARGRLFAEILRVNHFAILAAFHLRKPRLAHVFAHHKFMLIQASAADELDEATQDAVAAVDFLTVLDAHMQFYEQLAEAGRAQLGAAEEKRSKD
ncbi:MAG: hypothetical protein A2790_10915 [Phenylobacterium sp. RIFCSPHIGHO2_01_FULL_69_31]|uniref:hypothetical protein n=1 Tax=unclassified Phenylobacterium TaxID=2640670 RepID=UPI0008C770FB|nr:MULTISPECIES: hypothetical protein [unclassified Phenylobacterium]OHB31148.1 MAG: hypothetical protein A2790_10915 [Phenylobacterium sp. RIFCSPHIGHO2_01_FULL_69_31]TAJ73736.1 MAG: hypothetical protein EPO51_04475 [Phenylobacterium sp.]